MNIDIKTVIAELKERYQFQSSVDAFLIMTLIDYTEQLQQPVVVRGGDNETVSVELIEDYFKWFKSNYNRYYPTEPLTAEGEAKSVSVDECDHSLIESSNGFYCSKCNRLV
jgi:hypothetical protein